MTRLTNDIREAITNDILKHRFTDDLDKLREQRAAFALKVYNDIFPTKTQEHMETLPDGWLPRSNNIGVQFGYGHNFTRLSFNGSFDSGILVRLSTKIDNVFKRILASKEHGCAKSYDPQHPLTQAADRLNYKRKDLADQIDVAKKSIETALSKVSSIGRLIETWPEVAQFVNKHETGKPQLPSLPTDHLNELLRLP